MRPNLDATEIGQVRSPSSQGHISETGSVAATEFSRKGHDAFLRQGIVTASRSYRFFEYELSIFIACRVFPKGRKMAGTQRLQRVVNAASSPLRVGV